MNNDQYEFKNYKIIQQIGKGTFGIILKAIKNNTQNTQNKQSQQQFAIKIQSLNTIKPLLHIQYELLKQLKKNKNEQKNIKKGYQFPNVYEYQQTDYFSFMAMEMLSITLQEYANKQVKNKISKDCLIRIMYNLLKIIQNIHNLGYIHRDIKPANFMLKKIKTININNEFNNNNINSNNNNNINNNNQTILTKYYPLIYPIDLGLAKRYINPITTSHIIYKQNKKLIGTAIFCSLNTHKGIQQSRRDDLQSLIYLIVYIVKKLPWEYVANINNINNINGKNDEKNNAKGKVDVYEEIYKIKKQTDFKELINDMEIIPECVYQIYIYTQKLQFQENPDYIFMYNLMEKEHQKLTNRQLTQENSLCEWQNYSINQINQTKQHQKLGEVQKKKIKINFKIPSNKLKSSLSTKIKQTQTKKQQQQILSLTQTSQ